MSATECSRTLSQPFVSKWSNILLVSTLRNGSTPIVEESSVIKGTTQLNHGLTCGSKAYGYCSEDIRLNADNGCVWYTIGVTSNFCNPISHCLAQKATQHCSLRFNVYIMVAVITCNAVKLSCIIGFIWRGDSSPMVTIGDAVASFLDTPGKQDAAINLFVCYCYHPYLNQQYLPFGI